MYSSFKYLSIMSNLVLVQRMEKLEKEMKSDMTGAKRDSMTEIFPGQPLIKGESQKNPWFIPALALVFPTRELLQGSSFLDVPELYLVEILTDRKHRSLIV